MMTTGKMFLLRLFNVTLGRFSFFSRFLKKVLILFLITRKKKGKYVASSRFFEWSEIVDSHKNNSERP